MCPVCIGSALLLLTGASSAGGLALIASRACGAGLPATRAEDSENLNVRSDQNCGQTEPAIAIQWQGTRRAQAEEIKQEAREERTPARRATSSIVMGFIIDAP
jgi:hypothetical protein